MRRLAIALLLLAITGVAAWRLNVFAPGTARAVAAESVPRPGIAAAAVATTPAAVGAGGVAATSPVGVPVPSEDLRRLTYAHAWSGPQPAGLAEFRDWVGRYLQAGTVAARDALETDGVALARARRAVMRALIESDPETALALTVPAEIRRQLPAAILAELETRFSIVGDFSVLAIDYGPAELARRRSAGLKTESFQRFVVIDGREVEASVYGRRVAETTKHGIPLHGVLLDERIALHAAAVRVLESGENSPAGPSGAGNGVAAAVGRKSVYFASATELLEAEARFEAAEKGLGPDPIRIADPTTRAITAAPDAIAPLFPQAPTAWTTGNKQVLIIRIDFPDFPGDPFRGGTTYTKNYVQNFADTEIGDYFSRSSYGQTSLTNTVTTQVYRMPQTGVSYATSGTSGANTQLHADAQAAANAHYAVSTYDRVIVLFRSLGGIANSKITYGGLADVGARRVWLNGEFDFRATAHELGHTYGVFHANFWQVTDGNPVSASGTSTEYGDDFDTMGANFADDDRTDFNPWFKNLFGWVADNQVQTITSNGTYRINRFDHTSGTGTLALMIPRDATRNYWVGIRRNFTGNASMQNGAYVIWGYNSNDESNVLDLTTPGTNDQDVALAAGATLTDTVGNLSIRTLALGGTAPFQYADIQVSLGLNGIPVISTHPQGQGFSIGAAINLSVVATGTAPLSYQWRKNTVDIAGAIASTYSIPSALSTDAGSYSVRVTNTVGNVLSNTATLLLNAPPAISSPPKHQTVAAGFSAVFSVFVTSGSTATYQWRRNGVNLPGATSSSLIVSNVQNANAGAYDVVVTNALGQATSAPALLTVMLGGVVPSNDHFSGAWNLPGNFGRGYTVSNGASGEAGEPVHYTSGGAGGQTSSVWFRWTPSVSGVAQIDTIGSVSSGGAFFDTVLAVYTGSSLGSLTKLAQDDDSGSATAHTSKVTINVTAGTTYAIAVGGFETDDQGVVALNHSVQTPPAIVTAPMNVARNEGGSATFNVGAIGVPGLIYQWQKNGVAIPGAIGTSLTISPVTLAMSGDQFRCVVNSVAGATTSAAATLTVFPASTITITSPNHAVFHAGVAGTFTVTATGAPAPTFSVSGGNFPFWATLNAATGVIEGTPPEQLGEVFNFTLRASNGVGAPVTQAFTLEAAFAPAWAMDIPGRSIVGRGANLTLSAPTTGFPAATYQWKRNGMTIAGATSADFSITSATSRDQGWYQVVATNSAGSVTSPVMFVNVGVNPAQVFAWGDNAAGATTVPSGLLSISAVTGGNGHSLALKTDGTVVAWGKNNSGQAVVPVGLSEVVRIAAGSLHSVALKSNGTVVAWGENGSGQATVPAGLTGVVAIAAGEAHSLALKSDGTVIAWGSNTDGQSSVPLGLTGVAGVTAGRHSVAWRADGSVVAWGYNSSGQANVPATVNQVVSVVAGLSHNVALKGDGTVVAWGANGADQSIVPAGLASVVEIAAGAEYSLTLKADGSFVSWGGNTAGQRTVPSTVVNAVGLGSGVAHVMAISDALPRIISQPQSVAANPGESVGFSVDAMGVGTLTYQWRKDGVALGGPSAQTATVMRNNVQAADTGSYDVVVSNSFGSGISNAATLTFAGADAFANRIALAGTSVAAALVSSLNASKEAGEPAHAGNNGGKSVWWTWTAPYHGHVTVDTIGSDFDTVLGIYTGSSVAVLTTVASDDNSGASPGASKLTFLAVAGTTYQIAVDGMGGAGGNVGLNVGYAYVFSTIAVGAGSSIPLDTPRGVGVDGSGNIFVANTGNFTISKIPAGGNQVITFAGLAGDLASIDGVGSFARFGVPFGLAVDASANVFVSEEGSHTIRRITPASVVTTVAGTAGVAGSANGTGSAARFNHPGGVAVDGAGNLYVADIVNHTIRKITAGGVVTTLAGMPGVTGSADGTGSAARFNSPVGVAVDGSGTVFVADASNHTIRKITPGGVVTTWAGLAGSFGHVDGRGGAARFSGLMGMAVDSSGNVWVADTGNYAIRKINAIGMVTTVAGSVNGNTDGLGSVARFVLPMGVAVDGSGNLLVADTMNHSIRKGVPSYALPPTITPPANQSVSLGGTGTIAVTAIGNGTLTYQWRFNGSPISDGAKYTGTTTTSLTLSNAQPADAGGYVVVATNSHGSTLSAVAAVTVVVPPSVPAPPASATVAWGGAPTLSVAAGGSGPFSYQWYGGASGDASAPISGATSSAYTTPALTATASYWVRVTNFAGVADSATATITVASFAPTVALTSESGATYDPAGGTAILRVRVDYLAQSPTSLNVVVALPAGWTFSSYAGPAATTLPNAGTSTPTWAFAAFPADALTFTFTAAYPAGLTGDQSLTGQIDYHDPAFTVSSPALSFRPLTPPVIATQPVALAVGGGVGTTFSVVATGPGTLTYQWQKDGNILVSDGRISGMTSATLVIPFTSVTDAGVYSVTVSNSDGNVTSDGVALAVIDAHAVHDAMGPGYVPGGTVTITNTFTYPGALTAMGWLVLLPPGWSFVSDTATAIASRPTVGTTDILEWSWITPLASGTTFTYTVAVPVGASGTQTITTEFLPLQSGIQYTVLADPDPRIVDRVFGHSADWNQDGRLSLTELLRVIEIYNARFGTVRTGAYQFAGVGATEDGFLVDIGRAANVVVNFRIYHAADSNHDGKISLTELLRVIELYNYRNGTVRTGEYHVQITSEDGFTAGP